MPGSEPPPASFWIKMAKGISILYLFAVAVIGQALTPSTYFTTVDQQRLRTVFETSQPYADVTSAHYSILGLKLLNIEIPKPKDVCKTITSSVEKTKLSSIYHAAVASNVLGNCKLPIDGAQKLLSDAIKEEAPVLDIFYAVLALKNLGLKIDSPKASKALTEALKRDDSAVSHGYAFHVAAELSGDTSKLFDSIEDIVAQADEVDDKYLQFEGGLFVTSLVVDGAFKLAENLKKAPTISEDKVIKFANYFLSRKHVHQLKSAYHFLSVIKTLTDNKFFVPIAVTLASPVSVSETNPKVQVHVVNLLGGSLGKLTVTADSARHLGDDSVILSKKPFSVVKSDSSLYELNLMDAKPARGFYKVAISVAPLKADKRLVGTSGAEVQLKVTTKVAIDGVEVSVSDKDQSTAPKITKIQHPKKLASVLEADYHQKVIVKFQLKDKTTGKLMLAHQTFVRLTNQNSGEEVIFITESDSAKINKFDLDVSASAKVFGYKSGKYSLEVIIGDTVIENPFSWILADVLLTFPEGSAATDDFSDQYKKKPGIEHLFRVPEKRPPAAVSTAFTAIALIPLLILIVLWMKLGVNFSNFPVTISAIGFHGCLAAIFGLYYCYWSHLNMFTTLRYLSILGIPTFLFGNRLLSSIAAKRK